MQCAQGLLLDASILARAKEAEAAFGCHEDGLAAAVSEIAQRIANPSSTSFWAA